MAYEGRGNVHVAQGEFQQAVDDLSHAIDLDDRSNYIYAIRGLAYDESRIKMKQAHWPITIIAIQELCSATVLYILCAGACTRLQGDYDHAIADFHSGD